MQRTVNMVLSTEGRVTTALFSDIKNDAIHMKGDNSGIEGCRFYDKPEPALADEDHRDAIQVIPTTYGLSRSQFAGALINGLLITNNTILCHSKMQPIFSSDGRIKTATITNNTILTRSDHHISLNGLLSGVITGNHDLNGNYVKILAQPVRLGGETADGKCLWVVSFKNPEDDYQCIITDDDNTEFIDNRRCTRVRPTIKDYYLADFDMQAYLAEAYPYLAQANAQQIATPTVCAELINQAFQYGNSV